MRTNFLSILANVEIPMLADIVWIFGLATVVILLFIRFNIPTIIGFLLTGALAGPFGFSLVNASQTVEVLSEIGVILLLFVIGLEFSLKSLLSIKKAVFVGGALQVVLTVLATYLASTLLGFDWNVAVFIGFLFSLSSTAIVLKLLQEEGKVGSISGRTTLAILIFQDIAIVPLMLLTPMLAGANDNVGWSLFWLGLKGIGVVILTLIGAKYLVPKLLYRIAASKSEELFLLSIIVICFAVAYLTSLLGLSLGLGAFLAGLIISESDYSHHATGKILPFREVFLSFFFVSIGMLFDVGFFVQHLLPIFGLTLVTILVKFLTASVSVRLIGQNLRESLIVGLSIFQLGEFSLLLAKVGIQQGLLDTVGYQYFLSITLLTMALTPFAMGKREWIASKICNLPITGNENMARLKKPAYESIRGQEELKDHLVIIGFGLNGHNLAKAAKTAKIPYIIVEMNPATVKRELALGEPIIFGDASNETILRHVEINKARVAVIAISNADATKRIVSTIRHLTVNPYIIVRTRYVNEIEENLKLGADEVIPEEFETSIEIFTRVLGKYLIPRHHIEDFTEEVRSHNYAMFRKSPGTSPARIKVDLPDINLVGVLVEKDSGDFINKALKDTHIRQNLGVNIVAIKRNEKTIYNITGDDKIKFGDLVYVVGKQEAIERFQTQVEIS